MTVCVTRARRDTGKSTTFEMRQTPWSFSSLFCKMKVMIPCMSGRPSEIRCTNTPRTEYLTHGDKKRKKVWKNVR